MAMGFLYPPPMLESDSLRNASNMRLNVGRRFIRLFRLFPSTDCQFFNPMPARGDALGRFMGVAFYESPDMKPDEGALEVTGGGRAGHRIKLCILNACF